jgi:hypothetical protein
MICLRSAWCPRKFSTKIRRLTNASKPKLLLFESSNVLLSCRWKHCGSSEFWYPPTRLYGVFLCSRCGSRTRGQNGEEWWSSRKANRARNVLGRSPATRWVTWSLSSLTAQVRWVRSSTSSQLPLTALISYWAVHPLLHWSAPNARAWQTLWIVLQSIANWLLSTVKSCILITVKPTLTCYACVKNGHTVQVHITSQLSIITANECTKFMTDVPSPLHDGWRLLSRGVKRPGRELHHLLPSSAEARNEWSYTYSPPCMS